MDIGEGVCYGECCEVCKPDDSQTCTPVSNNTLYVNKKNSWRNILYDPCEHLRYLVYFFRKIQRHNLILMPKLIIYFFSNRQVSMYHKLGK